MDDAAEEVREADEETRPEQAPSRAAIAKHELVRAAILAGMTLGTIAVAAGGGPTTVASIAHI